MNPVHGRLFESMGTMGILLVQTPTVIPDPASPWYYVIVIAAALALIELVRRYINARIDKGIEANRLSVKREETETTIRLTSVESERDDRRADAEALRLLANSLDNLAKSNQAVVAEISTAYQHLAADRQQAAQEREGFRMTAEGTTKELERQANELARLATAMEDWSVTGKDIVQQIKDIRERIGGEKDEPPLTKLIGEAAEAAKQASEALARAASEGGGKPSPEMADATTAMEAASAAIGLVSDADKQAPAPSADAAKPLKVGDTVKLVEAKE